ncbi:MAG: hypothetical protein QNJ08_05865 [Crocosphaera sp.]|nr:hypothetical protein [Crocosphaera sp.]
MSALKKADSIPSFSLQVSRRSLQNSSFPRNIETFLSNCTKYV